MDEVLRQDLIIFLEKQEGCDIIFKLNGNVEVKAHSYILSGELFIRKMRFYVGKIGNNCLG